MKKNSQLCLVIALSTMIVMPSNASLQPAILNQKNNSLVAEAKAEIKSFHQTQEDTCADPNEEGSLAKKQAEVINEQKKMASTPINLTNIYNIANKNGCFAALSNFPDLSVTIPSLSGILTSVKDTLVKYAVRKACAAVDQAFSEMLAPLEKAIGKVSDRGQIDLNGRVNKEISKKLYEIDPEFGRSSTSSKPASEYDFKW